MEDAITSTRGADHGPASPVKAIAERNDVIGMANYIIHENT